MCPGDAWNEWCVLCCSHWHCIVRTWRLIQELGIKPRQRWYAIVMAASREADDHNMIAEVLLEAEEHGSANIVHYTTALVAMSDAGAIHDALRTYVQRDECDGRSV